MEVKEEHESEDDNLEEEGGEEEEVDEDPVIHEKEFRVDAMCVCVHGIP